MRMRRLVVQGIAVLASASMAAVGLAAAPSHAALKPLPRDPGDFNQFLGGQPPLSDIDVRGIVPPDAAIRAAVARLGSGVQVAYNGFGTPSALTRTGGGWLSTGLHGPAVQASREWLSEHRAMFALTDSDLSHLQLVNDAPLVGSKAHAVLFRESYDGYNAGNDGLIAIGIRGDNVASVTSTLRGGLSLDTTKPSLSPEQAVLAAARNDGLKLTLADLSLAPKDNTDFTNVAAKGFAQVQRARLVALPTVSGARLAYETDIENVQGGSAFATISFVDAVTGRVLVRHWDVDALDDGASGLPQADTVTLQDSVPAPTSSPAGSGGEFTGTFTPTACGPKQKLSVPAGTQTLLVTAAAANSADDISLNVYENGTLIGNSDEATSPEAVAASVSPASKASDTFQAEVCPSPAPAGPFVPPYNYSGVYYASDQSSPKPQQLNAPYPPMWKYFPDSPTLGHDKDTRTLACWTRDQQDPAVTQNLKKCQQSVGNIYSHVPWDVEPSTGFPTFSTIGNNANEAEAWYSTTLTPGPTYYHTTSANRQYTAPFTDEWYTSRCNPDVFASPARNDIDAVETNLFVGHNIVHDFAYRLGFTEGAYNNQQNNFGLTGPEQQNDPELGDVQSGAVSNTPISIANGAAGGTLPVEGRDNANQVPEQDGVPGITNQYLFQPIVGFYGPCHDGDLDMSVYGHEYTHEISNRMIAGPDTGLSGQQGGSMGESWSDLDALELLHSLGYAGSRGENPDSVGAYVTGNNQRGIRDYALNHNPLNYSDLGFDTTGPEVHADGEIWNGVQWKVRAALIHQYRKTAPPTRRLERACATGWYRKGTLAPGFKHCPGDRHWIQYIYDSWLLEASGTPTMADMKNLMLAANKLRTGGRDFRSMADAFAHRGFGANASSTDSDDIDPKGGFASPVKRDNAHVHFRVVDARTGKPVKNATVYVGRYQARVTPFAHTGSTKTMVRGGYQFLVQAPGYGEERFRAAFKARRSYHEKFRMAKNLASKTNGASISGPGIRLSDLIDDSEATDAGYDGSATRTPIRGKAWTVNLAGGKHLINRINVSAEHHPVSSAPNDFQGRFTDLRAFTIQVSSNNGKTYRTVYTSSPKFFPGRQPRPVAPDLILRTARFKPVKADHVRLVIRTNQCTGFKLFHTDDDNDPTSNSNCAATADAYQVTAAELEVFGPTR